MTTSRMRIGAVVFALLVAGIPARPDERTALWPNRAQEAMAQALASLDMNETDLRVTRDIGRPTFALSRPRLCLTHPLACPQTAESAWSDAAAGNEAMARLLVRWLDAEEPAAPASTPDIVSSAHNLMDAVDCAAIRETIQLAFADFSESERRTWACGLLAGMLRAEDLAPMRERLRQAGFTDDEVEEAVAVDASLDSRPYGTNLVARLNRLDRTALAKAGLNLLSMSGLLEQQAQGIHDWPDTPIARETPWGRVIIGTLQSDTYLEPAALILDPGGDDVYAAPAGVANGLAAQPIAMIIDLEGDDLYVGGGLLGPGSALFGCCVIRDAAGDDLYRTDGLGQACAIMGCAASIDKAGDDLYRARTHSQAAATVGLALLEDQAGRDLYDLGFAGQAYAGVLGAAALVDRQGNDRYLSGGVEPDFERHDLRFLSMAQGFAIGSRPFAGGGVAALIDLEGNDDYVADIYGQGSSYWYALGLLIDAEGEDRYTLHQYGQGSGIHLSCGLLADGAGNDRYVGETLVQGNAHDFAVGWLIDRTGHDRYTGGQHAQGRAINNALAVLADFEGNDVYASALPDEAQGIGNDGGKREFGSLALLLDLGGTDRYACEATNNATLTRPDFGVVFDTECETHEDAQD